MKEIKQSITKPFFLGLLSLAVYQPVMMLVEYLTTEKYLLLIEISSQTKTLIFLGILLLVVIFSHKLTGIINQKSGRVLVAVLSAASLLAGSVYQDFYQDLQRQPRIYAKNIDWSIQGSKIVIKGKNFGQAHEPGVVYLDQVDLVVKKWSDKKIVVEQPVTGNFGRYELCIENSAGYLSNCIEHTIKNPSELQS